MLKKFKQATLKSLESTGLSSPVYNSRWRRLAAERVDIQLHTHRHRTPMDRQLFLREIEDNRKSIEQMTGKSASHFYPATTCELGLASRSSEQLLLPRFLDSATLSPSEFESWLTGVSAALPRRSITERAYSGGTS